jgi:dihydroflavonol-4-reductase
MAPALILGASGFLGSHVVQQLVAAGRPVRIFTRATSDIRSLADLPLERHVGDIHDLQSIERVMQGCDTVFHCIVDTRAWIRDNKPLYRTNVDGTRNILDAALSVGVKRLVYTSSVVTIGLSPSGISDEDTEFNWWDHAPDYVKSRVLGERLVHAYVDKGLDAVICNVSTTFGEGDLQPTPHGELAQRVALGTMPVSWGSTMNVVGIKDAARAMVLAEQRGRCGERYLITDRLLTMREFCDLVADIAQKPRPKFFIPLWLMMGICAISQTVMHALGKDTKVSIRSLQLSRRMGDFDNSKARRELGWEPRPFEESIRDAVLWFQHNRTRT